MSYPWLSRIDIRGATPADWPAIQTLLESERLPIDDLSAQALRHFQVAHSTPGILGAVGIELYGTVALLRSLVVAPLAQRQGIGRLLTQAAETSAARTGVQELYLLTQTAGSFFESLGFHPSERARAPEAIQRTRQFSTLCPTTSVLMVKNKVREIL
jgi:amino-acid N-acetyltransferase